MNQSYGQFLIGTQFNPSGNPDIDVMKNATAELIDILSDLSTGCGVDAARSLQIAIEHLETASMFAVKGIIQRQEDIG